MNLCVIPAKKHSQRLPGKNRRSFLGKPIIQYSIDTALNSGIFDRIVVSSDCDEIGTMVAKMGAIYHRRSPELAMPDTPMVDVVLDVIHGKWVITPPYSYHTKTDPEFVCMIYPCAPFVTVEQLVHGLDKLKEGFDVVFPVYKGPHPEGSFLIRDNRLVGRYPEHEDENSCLWPDAYYSAGSWYWAAVKTLEETRSFTAGLLYGIEVPGEEVQDIDDEADWTRAEIKYRIMRGGE